MTEPVRRDIARALLFDDAGRLVLIRRTRPKTPPYLVTPGGGVEPGEDSWAAVERECAEEVGAVVQVGPVVVESAPDPHGLWTVHLAILERIDLALRTGHEFAEAERGGYETVRVPWGDAEALATLRPPILRGLIAEHGAAWSEWANAAYEEIAGEG